MEINFLEDYTSGGTFCFELILKRPVVYRQAKRVERTRRDRAVVQIT